MSKLTVKKSAMYLLGACLFASVSSIANAKTLQEVVDARSDEVKVRDQYRNPAQTLSFFKLEPGMAVAEALPGGGWYTSIIAPFVGAEGSVHGINYNDDMWARFGFFTPEAIEQQIASTTKFPEIVAKNASPSPASSGFTFATAPDELKGSLDRVFFIRALHNLNRFEKDAGTMTEAVKVTKTLLKSGGMVGIVQHRAPESASDEWSAGQAGYLKQSAVISAFEAAGFELVGSSEINANPKDKPTESDIVWRLPPTYFGSNDDQEKRDAASAIGESDRMTLLFKKP